MHRKTVVTLTLMLLALATPALATTITFDDVVGSNQVITNRYIGLGVTLAAIANPFPLAGTFPAPAVLPTVLGGVQTWTEGFPSATSGQQVAVSMTVPGSTQPGNAGILISFAFDVSLVSLVGNDLGGCLAGDCESVTLSAYNAAGNLIGQTFSNSKLPGFDRTLASIALPGMRHVAYNYTDTQFGFYAIDDLTFETSPAAVPEPMMWSLLLVEVAAAGALLMRTRRVRPSARRQHHQTPAHTERARGYSSGLPG